ncbi:hypothetical protein [Nonomuraea diastatica]|uniref:Uncharacterized protein n=1 Tax=Nonomuraea diastatica TaxID=1848329 RepID=A0A4R4W045_9ACTN|nr:hypothetical protein [Nonomuraea diastatica]TDD08245.1 hypothetical protein E1294_47695 [Nonomuraea diastatica]
MPIPMLDHPEILDEPHGQQPGSTLRDQVRDEIIPGLAGQAGDFEGAHRFITQLAGVPDTHDWSGRAAQAHMLLLLHVGALNPAWTFQQVVDHCAHLIDTADPDQDDDEPTDA